MRTPVRSAAQCHSDAQAYKCQSGEAHAKGLAPSHAKSTYKSRKANTPIEKWRENKKTEYGQRTTLLARWGDTIITNPPLTEEETEAQSSLITNPWFL